MLKKNQTKILSARERNLLFLYFASNEYIPESRKEKFLKRFTRLFGKNKSNEYVIKRRNEKWM